MAYLRRTTKLPSGNCSRYHVFGGPESIINMDLGSSMSYSEMWSLLKNSTAEHLQSELEKRLELNSEEAKFMADSLMEEKRQGAWDSSFDSYKSKPL